MRCLSIRLVTMRMLNVRYFYSALAQHKHIVTTRMHSISLVKVKIVENLCLC
jgi:hypothetical protein